VSKGLQIAAGATLVAALVGWYSFTNLEGGASFAYFQHLAEFQARAGELAGRDARVHGYVAPGSIQRDVAGRQVRFRVVNEPPHAGGAPGTPLEVVFTSLETPDLFQDGAEVVLEGRLAAAGGPFHADKLFAKCPSKFEAAPASGAASS
jgi:cytochrome c-type biogenesis protein CcmE